MTDNSKPRDMDVISLCSESDGDQGDTEPLVIPLATASDDDLQYLDGDPWVPVFITGENKPCDISKIVHMLVNKEFDSTKNVCTVNPRNARKNVGFIIARNSLGHERDVLNDGQGHWEKTKTKTILFGKNGDDISKIRNDEEYIFAETFEVKRHICYHRPRKNFHRVVLFIENCEYIYVQYYFHGKLEFVEDWSPHGNKRINATPYRKHLLRRVPRSIDLPPQRTVSTIMDDAGEILNVRSPEDIPRNRQQVSN